LTSFAGADAELLPEESNLQGFLVCRKTHRGKYIEDVRGEAQQKMINHLLGNEASDLEQPEASVPRFLSR
jgi:hypothetical protein